MAKAEKIITETNALTGETITRSFNDEEIAQLEADLAKFQADKVAEAAEASAKALAKAELLDRLGMTAEEAALLLA